MHLASRCVNRLYDSLVDSCKDAEPVPSRGYVESLLRMAGLLHDVGHGPFGHFFDDRYLRHFGLTHEIVGARIIETELAPLLSGIRRNPNSELLSEETLDPQQIAWLIQRPKPGSTESQPRWLLLLRSLLSGIYTIDNMDFVLRDAYMSGYSQQSFDLDRLIHYSFFTKHGLTVQDKGLPALLRFMTARSELFRTIYFHRTVRAIDLTLIDLFDESKAFLFPGNPLEHLESYRDFTESSLLVDVTRWHRSPDAKKAELGDRWRKLIGRNIPWKMVCQRNLVFSETDSERSSIFADSEIVASQIRKELGWSSSDVALKVDIARHIYRPMTRGPAQDQNFLFDSSQNRVRPLTDSQLFQRLPVSYRTVRIYSHSLAHADVISKALDALTGSSSIDDLTNM